MRELTEEERIVPGSDEWKAMKAVCGHAITGRDEDVWNAARRFERVVPVSSELKDELAEADADVAALNRMRLRNEGIALEWKAVAVTIARWLAGMREVSVGDTERAHAESLVECIRESLLARPVAGAAHGPDRFDAAPLEWPERWGGLVIGATDAVRDLVNKQAKDEGLWFMAASASEAYLQQELRRLHTLIEAAPVVEASGEREAARELVQRLYEERNRNCEIAVGLAERINHERDDYGAYVRAMDELVGDDDAEVDTYLSASTRVPDGASTSEPEQ